MGSRSWKARVNYESNNARINYESNNARINYESSGNKNKQTKIFYLNT